MRSAIALGCCVIAAGICGAGAAFAQGLPPGLAGLTMVQPEPERAGDRALSCAQITREMGLIMQQRNVQKTAATSKRKICGSKKVLDRQVSEKMRLQQAQTPLLMAAGTAPGPASTAILAKVNADNLALENQQQPDRQRANAEMMSGAGDMIGVFNDPRLMRLAMLAQERQCAESAPRPPPSQPADACEGGVDSQTTLAIPGAPVGAPAGPADPFAPRGKPTPQAPGSAGADPFAHR